MNYLQVYFQEVTQVYQGQNSTEYSYRPAFKKLMESLDSGIQAINEPKRIACGAPDFVVKNGILEIGHIEAKNIGVALKKVEKTAQMGRYFQALGNLILTDYLEFRWYVQGELKLSAALGTIDKNKKIKVDQEGMQEVDQLLRQFLLAKVPQITTPKDLAKPMASLAQLMRDAIKTALNDVDKGGTLREQLESFQRVLIKDLTVEQFADMYAQTICYGLFAARCNTDNVQTFSRETAAFKLPKTNPFLRSIFGQIAGPDLDDRISWAVDNLARILQQTEMAEILKDFGKRTRREDPVVHFYETFLAEYDPKMRESRGVYYTPEPVVNYIVKSVDYILKHKFNIGKGLADSKKIKVPNPQGEGTMETHQVWILDPAVGTGTFIHNVIDFIYDKFKNQRGMWSSYVSQHLLPRLFGFELLMAPYTVAHIKLVLQLQELGYDFSSEERLRIYLTNTLQEAFQLEDQMVSFSYRIKQEVEAEPEAAKLIKQENPVMVILGNPPYSGHSVNTGDWIKNLLKGEDSIYNCQTGNYFEVDGKPLGEKNPKWLNDDYVKFIRFSQWRIEKTGYGILAFITNHGYLDNPTFRGMRQSLMETFDEIYVLDLHGNSKKKEVCPDGSADQNVFDIQQGVAIGFFIKYQNKEQNSQKQLATVYHADLWGSREVYENKQLVGGKYHWLGENDISSTNWEQLAPNTPFYLFKPQNIDLRSEYEKMWRINEIMNVNVLGFQTHRDHFAIDFDEENITKRFEELRENNLSNQEYADKYNITNNQNWELDKVRKAILSDDKWKAKIITCLYRPFDLRYCYYSDVVMDRPRKELLNHVFRKDNLVFNLPRIVKLQEWRHSLISNVPCTAISMDVNGSYIFPLYLYPTNQPTLDKNIINQSHERKPNLSPEFITQFSEKLGLEFIFDGKGDKTKTFRPEDIFNYIYAIFHSPNYRQRYAEFLKIDFPRVPLTANAALFWELVIKGDKLVKYHLIKETGTEISTYPIPGSDLVEQVKYHENHQQIWINSQQYFDQVPQQIWNFYIGGYQVCQKWLKDRKGRRLNFDDISHYRNIISIISETVKIMEDIDKIIEKYGGFPLE
jgi:predicted helicase